MPITQAEERNRKMKASIRDFYKDRLLWEKIMIVTFYFKVHPNDFHAYIDEFKSERMKKRYKKIWDEVLKRIKAYAPNSDPKEILISEYKRHNQE